MRIIDGPYKKTVRQGAPEGYYNAIFLEVTVRQRENGKDLKKEDVHFDLMTQEAIRDLMDKTVPDGVVCYHTSHRTHQFYKSLSASAAALGFAYKKAHDRYPALGLSPEERQKADSSHFSSEWLVIARRVEHLTRLRNRARMPELTWEVPDAGDFPAWRDGAEPVMPLAER
ncbi:MAG: hypothetical protein U0744_03265 [Gemmataceae bacterium]